MTSPAGIIDARLDELLERARDAVAASDLPDKSRVTVTDDGRKVATAESLKAGAIVIYPMPAIEYLAPRTTRLTWTIAVVATADTPRAGARRMEALLDLLLRAGITEWRDRAQPTDFQLTDQSAIPGYTITHTEEHTRRTP